MCTLTAKYVPYQPHGCQPQGAQQLPLRKDSLEETFLLGNAPITPAGSLCQLRPKPFPCRQRLCCSRTPGRASQGSQAHKRLHQQSRQAMPFALSFQNTWI